MSAALGHGSAASRAGRGTPWTIHARSLACPLADTGAKAGPRQEKVIEVPEGVNGEGWVKPSMLVVWVPWPDAPCPLRWVAALELVQGILPALTDPSIKGPPRVARDPKKLSSAIVTADMDPNAHAVKFEAKVRRWPRIRLQDHRHCRCIFKAPRVPLPCSTRAKAPAPRRSW